MSGTFFISDLHLDAARPETTRAVATFLDTHQHCTALYILGDLFDSWLGDDDDSPFADSIRQLLTTFSAAGPQLYLMRGNRDFLLGADFAAQTGATLLPDSTVIDLYGKPTLLLHGDTLCTDDTAYQAFRARVRAPAWSKEILSRPLSERRELARELRGASVEHGSAKPPAITDVSPVAVTEAMARHGVTQLIHGHTHRPAHHPETGGERWVLGEWGDTQWVAEASAKTIKLVNI